MEILITNNNTIRRTGPKSIIIIKDTKNGVKNYVTCHYEILRENEAQVHARKQYVNTCMNEQNDTVYIMKKGQRAASGQLILEHTWYLSMLCQQTRSRVHQRGVTSSPT